MAKNQIVVRAAQSDDAADIAAIFDEQSVVAETSQLPFRSVEFWQDFYKNANPAAVELVACIDSRVVGHLGLLPDTRPRRRHVASFGLAVHADFHRQGVAAALMDEMINVADNWLNLLKISLSVYSDNYGAIALYERYGFVREGESRYDTFRKGRYSHSLSMARFHPKQISELEK